MASGRAHGHHQVWARDSMIALLGAGTVHDASIRTALLNSIELLESRQTPAGLIPNNVDAATGAPNFRAYADGGLWYVVGSSLMRPNLEAIRRTLFWYECQDVDQTGLLSMQEAADWQDLFCTRGKGLYLNCLYVAALGCAASVAEAAGEATASFAYLERAGAVKAAINRHLWYRGDGRMERHIIHSFSTPSLETDSLGRRRWTPTKRLLAGERYYLPYLSFREAGEWFDVFGNLLAILTGVADCERSGEILDFIERHRLAEFPIRAIYPAIQPGDADWRDYYGSLNQPHHYHNGGIWPFLGGFYVAALVKCGRLKEARAALLRLSAQNVAGEFNEWRHGLTGEPMGVKDQAWSSGMQLFALECVRRGATRPPFSGETPRPFD